MRKTKTIINSILALPVIGALLLLPLSNASAANMDININYTGWTSVGANEVQVDADKITINNADVTITGNNFVKKTYNMGEWAKKVHAADDGSQIVATTGLTFAADTETKVPGAVELRWTKAARLRDGSECDVYMKIDNVTVQTPRTTSDGSEYHPVQEVAILSERNDYNGRVAFSAFGNQDSLGVQFDVAVKIFATGTDNAVEQDMIFGYEDLDICDRVYLANNHQTLSCWDTTEPEESESNYSESITLINGIVGNNIYVEDEDTTTLHFLDTENGRNTRIVPTKTTENDGIESRKSGFSFIANSANYKIHWAGSYCSTISGFIGTSKVITSAQGDYADKITYDESDEEVLWKETKTISATADEGYYISKIIVDGVVVKEYEPDRSQGRVTYTFDEVISAHEIIFEAAPLPAPDEPTVPDEPTPDSPATPVVPTDNPTTYDGVFGNVFLISASIIASISICLYNRRRG
jgi:hypothetical protein